MLCKEKEAESNACKGFWPESQKEMSEPTSGMLGEIVPKLHGAETQVVFQREIKMCL
jgi:hypothetical protein